MTVAEKREALSLMREIGLSERAACRVLHLSRSTVRYEAVPHDDSDLRNKIKVLAFERRRFGYRRIHAKLRESGDQVNHKRVYRIYTEENLKVRIRRRKRLVIQRGEPMPTPSRPGERWCMDFTSDTLYCGRRFRTLNVVDEFTRECVGIEVAFGLPSQRVTRFLESLFRCSGKPDKIRCDNGPEFRSKHTQAWAAKLGIILDFIDPGKPMQNAFCESFNGKFRDECLNDNWFTSIDEARKTIREWREDYNTNRPHSSLDYRTPAEVRQMHLLASAV